jgi:hypothetical protein
MVSEKKDVGTRRRFLTSQSAEYWRISVEVDDLDDEALPHSSNYSQEVPVEVGSNGETRFRPETLVWLQRKSRLGQWSTA